MALTAAELVARISISGADRAKADLQGMGGAVDSAGSKLGMLAGGVAIAAGVALVGLGAKSVKMAGDFQSSMTQLVTGANESKANLGLVSKGILDMAVQTGTSTKDLVSSMFTVESAGYHGAQGLSVLQAAAQGAKGRNFAISISSMKYDGLSLTISSGEDATRRVRTSSLLSATHNSLRLAFITGFAD